MTEPDTSALPSVREQREMTAEINERIRKRGECVWEQVGRVPVLIIVSCNGRRKDRFGHGYNFCPYCGGKLVTK